MTSAVGSVVIAAAQSVAKVYVIGGLGYAAVKIPKKAPLLPASSVSTYARFGFNCLTIPLIFSTIAGSVTIDSIGDYWFVLVGAVGVLAISFSTATLLGRIIPISNPADFNALRIAATFPNIVALPILIFPSLCEYEVVYQAFGEGEDHAEQYRQCVAKSNTMIFCYFFGWSLLFWSCGHPALMNAAQNKKSQQQQQQQQQQQSTKNKNDHSSSTTTLATNPASCEIQSTALTVQASQDDEDDPSQEARSSNPHSESPAEATTNDESSGFLSNIKRALLQVFTSPPFVAMLFAFAVGCITPIRDLFFSQGGVLRFIGAAAESLGQASSPMSTMVVAASLASRRRQEEEAAKAKEEEPMEHVNDDLEALDDDNNKVEDTGMDTLEVSTPPSPQEAEEESPVMSDPNFGPLQLRRRSSLQRLGTSFRRSSLRAIQNARNRRTKPEQRRLLLWFGLSKLVISPALVVLSIVGLDCSGVLANSGVPDLAKLVLIVNASVPGALIVVVLLKSNPELHETAAVVAKVYFPTYLLSIFTIAAWTAVGLIVSIPDEDGNSFCARYQ